MAEVLAKNGEISIPNTLKIAFIAGAKAHAKATRLKYESESVQKEKSKAFFKKLK